MNKVCFVINSFNIGGIERVIVTLCNELSKYHYVDLVVLKNYGTLKDTLSSDVNVIDFGGKKVRNSVVPFILYLKENCPKYIVTSIWPITILVRLAITLSHSKSKQIVTHHSLFDLENRKNALIDFFTKKIMAYFYNKTFKVFAVSLSVQDFLQKIGVKNVTVMYNPFDATQHKQSVLKEIDSVKKYGDYFVFVGRLAKIKNIPLILKAFSELTHDALYKDYNLLVIGDGPEKNDLVEMTEGLCISKKCFFLGTKTYPEAFIQRAKAVLMASFSEAMPVTVLEAFGFNVPVVSTPAQGCMDIFNLLNYKWHTDSFDNVNEYCTLVKSVLNHKNELPNLETLVECNYGLEKIISLWNEVLV